MSDKEFQFMINIAVDYYLKGKTQNQIAKEHYISRPKVSRILKKARELGIVEIKINYDNGNFNKLKRDIKRIFSVKDIYVVPTLETYNDTLEEVCKKAADTISTIIEDDMTIGISWGRSVLTIAKYIEDKKYNNINIVELFGTLNYNKDFNTIINASTELSKKLDATLYPLPSPIYVRNENAREALKQMPIVSDTLAKIKDVDVILTSIGRVSSNSKSVLWESYTDRDVKGEVEKNGGVGFILAHFFDREGKFLDLEYNKKVIGIPVDEIRKKQIFLVCAGVSKAKALYGALKGRMVDTLVCDEEILKKVLDYNDIYNDMYDDGF